jgi:hypothetical protein
VADRQHRLIILHLLEKEPDHRYQTAEGLVHDLQRLRDAGAAAGGVFRVGAHDHPLRLLPPSRLVGRDEQTAELEAAFAQALAGRCQGVLVSGAPGVGKTALVDQLRPVITGADGWWVAGKFRPVPPRSGVRRGRASVPGAGQAAAGRTGGRADRRPYAAACRARAERRAADCHIPGVRRPARGATGCG